MYINPLGWHCRNDCTWTQWCQVCSLCSWLVFVGLKPHDRVICNDFTWFGKTAVVFFKIVIWKQGVNTTIWSGVGWKYVCKYSLWSHLVNRCSLWNCPPTMCVQLDNYAKDNKSRYVFAYWSLLVAKGIFKEVFVSFLLVGRTHNDIDASFGRWNMKLREEDFPIISLLMKLYIDLENVPIIPHMFEEVPDFKAFIELYIWSGAHRLIRHTKVQQFSFYMRGDGVPTMQYKLLYTTQN